MRPRVCTRPNGLNPSWRSECCAMRATHRSWSVTLRSSGVDERSAIIRDRWDGRFEPWSTRGVRPVLPARLSKLHKNARILRAKKLVFLDAYFIRSPCEAPSGSTWQPIFFQLFTLSHLTDSIQLTWQLCCCCRCLTEVYRRR